MDTDQSIGALTSRRINSIFKSFHDLISNIRKDDAKVLCELVANHGDVILICCINFRVSHVALEVDLSTAVVQLIYQ